MPSRSIVPTPLASGHTATTAWSTTPASRRMVYSNAEATPAGSTIEINEHCNPVPLIDNRTLFGAAAAFLLFC